MPLTASATLELSTFAGGKALVYGPPAQSTLQLSTFADARVHVHGEAAFAYLALSTFAGSRHTVTGSARAELLLSTVVYGDGATREPPQYAVNALSGALSRYQGFGFDSFASCGQALYGARANGVYLIGADDDNGVPISARADLGLHRFDIARTKVLSAVWIGAETDGEASVRLRTGGQDYTYRALGKGEMLRAVPGKGLKGRGWRIELEVNDATQARVDMVELSAGISDRRWTR